MWSRIAVVLTATASCHAGLLGAGTGEGSCAAAPFRSPAVKWPLGCPANAACCSEYGYCRPQEEWLAGAFRDCNGVSNGRPLAAEAIDAENAAAAAGDYSAAGLLVVAAGVSTTDAATVPYAAVAPAVVAAAPAVAYAAAPVEYSYAAAPVEYSYAAAPAAVNYGYSAAAPVAAYGYAAAPVSHGYAAAPVSHGYAAATPISGYAFAAPSYH